MGTTFNNCHVRTSDTAAVAAAVRDTMNAAAYISDGSDGWVSVYPFDIGSDEGFAERLSAALSLPVLQLWEYDNDICGYHLYEDGRLRDEYESAPDYWVGNTDENGDEILPKAPEERERLKGKPEVLLRYCVSGTTADDIANALGTSEDAKRKTKEMRTRLFMEIYSEDWLKERLATLFPVSFLEQPDATQVMTGLADLLGIALERAVNCFEWIVAGDGEFARKLVGARQLSQAEKDWALDNAVRAAYHPSIAENALVEVERWLSVGADARSVDVVEPVLHVSEVGPYLKRLYKILRIA
jgi:hypothetical protein